MSSWSLVLAPECLPSFKHDNLSRLLVGAIQTKLASQEQSSIRTITLPVLVLLQLQNRPFRIARNPGQVVQHQVDVGVGVHREHGEVVA